MSRRNPLAVLAVLMAALALVVSAASASAATAAPVTRTAFFGVGGFAPGALPCQILVSQIRVALLWNNTAWANVLSNVFIYSGCGGAAI